MTQIISSCLFYSAGVLTATCGAYIDHGVLAVGVGSDAGILLVDGT